MARKRHNTTDKPPPSAAPKNAGNAQKRPNPSKPRGKPVKPKAEPAKPPAEPPTSVKEEKRAPKSEPHPAKPAAKPTGKEESKKKEELRAPAPPAPTPQYHQHRQYPAPPPPTDSMPPRPPRDWMLAPAPPQQSVDGPVQRPNPLSNTQKELMGRRRDGVHRREARQTLLHQLIWMDTTMKTTMGQMRWAIAVGSPERCGPAPRQIWARVFEKGAEVEQLVLIGRNGTADISLDGERFDGVKTQVVYWDPSAVNDISNTCITLAKFCHNCWNNIIMVPACQLQMFTDFLHWMKDARDLHLKRDTQSIRLDRLMAIEDVVQVLRDWVAGQTAGDRSFEMQELPADQLARDFVATACDFAITALHDAMHGGEPEYEPPEKKDLIIAELPPADPPQPPFGNCWPPVQQHEIDLYGLREGRPKVELDDILSAVDDWLEKNATQTAEWEDMTPYSYQECPYELPLWAMFYECNVPIWL